MKTLIAILAIMLTTSVHADTCDTLSEISSGVMTMRQHGVTMKAAINTFNDKDYPILGKYTRIEIKRAYKEPRFSTASYQNNAILDFENEAYSKCIEVLDK